MMVLRGDVGAVGNPNERFGLIMPADRCTWEQTVGANGVGYGITEAHYYPGNTVTIGGDSAPIHPIRNAVLGYIGKSGRFVQIAS